ncbi:MAG: AAA family ATPase [Blastocatellia bacterium]
MRIDRLIAENFKGFKHREFAFHPEFNLVVGVNGTGKTSVLDALSVALGGWFLGLRGYDSRPIRPHEVLLAIFEVAKAFKPPRAPDRNAYWEAQYPCSIEAAGYVVGEAISWRRTLNAPAGRTT